MRCIAFCVVAVCCGVASAGDGDKHLLRYRFAAGETLRWEVDQRSSVRNTMEKATEEAKTRTTSTKAWKVIDVMDDGEIELINLVERVRMANKLADRAEVVFDSDSDATPPPGFEDAARAVGVPLSSIQMTPRGEIVQRDIKHRQAAADPHEQVALLLPEGPIAVGDSWNQPQNVRVRTEDGATQTVTARRKHTLRSVSAGVATIATEFQVLSPTTPPVDGQLAHRMVAGTIRFDLERGRVLSQRLDVDRRVLGFAGPSSSMHLITRLEEKLQDGPTEVASRP